LTRGARHGPSLLDKDATSVRGAHKDSLRRTGSILVEKHFRSVATANQDLEVPSVEATSRRFVVRKLTDKLAATTPKCLST